MEVIYEETDNPEEALKGFFGMLDAQSNSCKLVGQKMAEKCSVPYLEDREGDKEGERKNWPTSFNDVRGALRRLKKLAGVYYHYPSMNLVLVDESGKKIGIRSGDLSMLGFVRREQMEKLLQL